MTFISWNIPSQGVTGLILNAIVANSPQPILSSIYYAYNGLFTSFMLGVEWNTFATHRKGLRVSTCPRGVQRGTYTLQLPKRIAVPLLLLSAALHWLCSQSIFLVSLDIDSSADILTYPNGTIFQDESAGDEEYITCGYSPIAIILTISLGLVMVLAAVLAGFRRFKAAEMPVAGSCSASISACCHVLDDDDQPEPDIGESAGLLGAQYRPGMGGRGNSTYSVGSWDDDRRSSLRTSAYSSSREASLKAENEIGTEAALLPVKWGVTGTMLGADSEMVGHCAFSSREVGELQVGEHFGYL
jgi:hypothetical protein